MIFFFIPIWVIAFVILIFLGLLHWVSMNIVTIFLIFVGAIVAVILLFKWPKQVLISAAAALVICGGVALISEQVEANNEPVAIYQAAGTCVFFDETGKQWTIPEGAIVARYTDSSIESEEKHSNVSFKYGGSARCSWYYQDEIKSASVGRLHEEYLGKKYGYSLNSWKLEEIEVITYKEYKKGDWWQLRE